MASKGIIWPARISCRQPLNASPLIGVVTHIYLERFFICVEAWLGAPPIRPRVKSKIGSLGIFALDKSKNKPFFNAPDFESRVRNGESWGKKYDRHQTNSFC